MLDSHWDADKLFRGFRIATMASESMLSPESSEMPDSQRTPDSHGTPASIGSISANAKSNVGGYGYPLTASEFAKNSSLLGIIDDAVLATRGDRIAWIVPEAAMPEMLKRGSNQRTEIIDGKGDWLTPGLIDCHTHLVYGGNRAHEWEARLRGATYTELAKAGGGILSTVTSTREASEDELLLSAQRRLRQFMREGVTTIEIKSGYGLNLESELKQLRVARRIGNEGAISVEPTLLAAHSVPPEYRGRQDEYVDWVCNEMIPSAVGMCTSVDAFCESIAFDLKQTERILRAALDHRLKIKVHAEQLTCSGSAAMAASMGAISADHLEYLSASDCATLAMHQTVATLLPGAFYCLRENQRPPVNALRQAGVVMAVASDCNPGSSPMCSILLAANMACNLFGLTVDEAWLGMTRHAARALRIDRDRGMLLPGMRADMARWRVKNLAEVISMLGGSECHSVYVGGQKRAEV